MHTCPECYMACDCDGEDHEGAVPPHCSHECEWEDEGEEWMEDQ